MREWVTDIGCAAGIIPFHATRLTIEGDDPAGAGSATLDDEKERDKDQHIVDDEDLRDDDLDDDQPRGRRTEKQVRAYDDLKSERDRLKAENERQERELAALNERMTAIEKGQETREEVNARTNAHLSKAEQRAREVVAEIKKLDKNDPEYATKVYSAMFKRVYTDLPEEAEEISRRTSSQVLTETRSREQAIADAEAEAVKALEEAGLSRDHLKLVRFMAREKRETEGEAWFKTTPKHEQVPKLVEEVATMLRGTKRNSQEFRDEKKRHREAMDGVIDGGTRGGRGASHRDDNEDRQEGPGSILADLSRLRQQQRRSTNIMLRQSER